jgi:hypothetical protein
MTGGGAWGAATMDLGNPQDWAQIWAWVRPATGGGVAADEVETDAGT